MDTYFEAVSTIDKDDWGKLLNCLNQETLSMALD